MGAISALGARSPPGQIGITALLNHFTALPHGVTVRLSIGGSEHSSSVTPRFAIAVNSRTLVLLICSVHVIPLLGSYLIETQRVLAAVPTPVLTAASLLYQSRYNGRHSTAREPKHALRSEL